MCLNLILVTPQSLKKCPQQWYVGNRFQLNHNTTTLSELEIQITLHTALISISHHPRKNSMSATSQLHFILFWPKFIGQFQTKDNWWYLTRHIFCWWHFFCDTQIIHYWLILSIWLLRFWNWCFNPYNPGGERGEGRGITPHKNHICCILFCNAALKFGPIHVIISWDLLLLSFFVVE